MNLQGEIRMESELHIDDPLRIGSRAEDFTFVVFERLDPAGDVAGVVWNVGGNAELAGNEGRASSARKFFHRIGSRSKTGVHVTVEPRWVPGPVPEFMQRRRREFRRSTERVFWRKLNVVGRG